MMVFQALLIPLIETCSLWVKVRAMQSQFEYLECGTVICILVKEWGCADVKQLG